MEFTILTSFQAWKVSNGLNLNCVLDGWDSFSKSKRVDKLTTNLWPQQGEEWRLRKKEPHMDHLMINALMSWSV